MPNSRDLEKEIVSKPLHVFTRSPKNMVFISLPTGSRIYSCCSWSSSFCIYL